MTTFLFDKIIFGPVKSRRLGNSLGINLLPTNSKVCTFDCVYCECGKTDDCKSVPILPTREEVKEQLNAILTERSQNNLPIDTITFAGNGEPTMHPQFVDIISDTLAIRNQLSPNARIAVLSNANLIGKPQIRMALSMVDDNILKLDSGIDKTIQQINQPMCDFDLNELIIAFQQFENNFTIQTMFIKGEHNGQLIDNTTDVEINTLIEKYKLIKPEKIMIYTIEREPASSNITAVSKDKLQQIAEKIRLAGFEVSIYS